MTKFAWIAIAVVATGLSGCVVEPLDHHHDRDDRGEQHDRDHYQRDYSHNGDRGWDCDARSADCPRN